MLSGRSSRKGDLTRLGAASLAVMLMVALATACGNNGPKPTAESSPAASLSTGMPVTQGGIVNKQWSAPPPMTIDSAKSYSATITTTKGVMTVELFARGSPITVNNFVFLAREGFYEGVRFHRIVQGFMIQGGDPEGTGRGGPGYRFNDETVTRDYMRGTLAMANAGPNTNGSQFFIVHRDSPLPKLYTIFGIVTSGLDVLDAIASTPVTIGPSGERSSPTQEVTIQRIEIQEA